MLSLTGCAGSGHWPSLAGSEAHCSGTWEGCAPNPPWSSLLAQLSLANLHQPGKGAYNILGQELVVEIKENKCFVWEYIWAVFAGRWPLLHRACWALHQWCLTAMACATIPWKIACLSPSPPGAAVLKLTHASLKRASERHLKIPARSCWRAAVLNFRICIMITSDGRKPFLNQTWLLPGGFYFSSWSHFIWGY